MCEPTTMMVMTAAQTAMSIRAQKQQASAQRQAQAAATARENQRYQNQMLKMRQEEAQENIIASTEIQKATKKAMKAKATARVAAGEAGVTGRSVQQLLDDYSRQEAEFRFGLQQQQRFNRISRIFAENDAGLQYQNNYAAINKPIQEVNYLAEGLNLAGNLMSIQSTAKSNELAQQNLDATQTLNQNQIDYNNAMLNLEQQRFERGD